MARFSSSLLLLFIFAGLCLGQTFNQKVCLYSQASTKVLTPLQLKNTYCPNNTTYCMNSIYNYGNFQYNGPASIKPVLGEVVIFLSQDEAGRLDFVEFLNAKVDTVLQVWTQITGATPTPIILKDDPTVDSWLWDPATNTGNFTWNTKPTYTDGVVIGHINFTDNYCLRTSFVQTNNALQKISIMSGTIANPVRILTVNYTSGSTFEFCQYPKTASTHTDLTCPGRSDGSATISILFGPSNIQYTWFNAAGALVGTGATIKNVPAGVYHVFVNDTSSNGCQADRYITILEPTLYASTVGTTQFTCQSQGSATATSSGGAGGIIFQWFKSDNTPIGSGSSIGNLAVGSYYLQTNDSCGSSVNTPFNITTIGCCGDGICQANEACSMAGYCAADCGLCCVPGTYINNGACSPCPPGSRSTTYQAISCNTCVGNTYNAGGTEACNPCPANTWSTAGSGKCVRCPVGQVRGANDTACHSCGAGSAASDSCGTSQCTQCPSGTFSADGAFACAQCAPGTFSSAGATSCDTCASNSYSGVGAGSCTACPQGTSSDAGSTHMLSCS